MWKSVQPFFWYFTLIQLYDFFQASAENLKNNKGSVLQIFSGKGNLKIIYYSAALVICQQGSGINIITFYAKSIFQESGSSLFSADSSSIIVAAVMTFTAVFTSSAAKIFRIRNLLIFSSIGIALSMVSYSIITYIC